MDFLFGFMLGVGVIVFGTSILFWIQFFVLRRKFDKAMSEEDRLYSFVSTMEEVEFEEVEIEPYVAGDPLPVTISPELSFSLKPDLAIYISASFSKVFVFAISDLPVELQTEIRKQAPDNHDGFAVAISPEGNHTFVYYFSGVLNSQTSAPSN